MAASASAPLRRAPATLWREGEFGVVLLGPADREPRTLTGTGRALWAALEEPISPADLVTALAEAFGVSSARVEADITPVLAELRRIGAIESDPA